MNVRGSALLGAHTQPRRRGHRQAQGVLGDGRAEGRVVPRVKAHPLGVGDGHTFITCSQCIYTMVSIHPPPCVTITGKAGANKQ